MATTTYDFDCTVAELATGDVIQIPIMKDAPWNTGIVKNVTEKDVQIFRPYGTNTQFTTTAGVICYTGTETFELRRDATKVHVYQRPSLVGVVPAILEGRI